MGYLLHSVMSARDPQRAEACRQADEADALRGLAGFQPARFFQAKCGRRRSFLSQRDADAYDAGWAAYRLRQDVDFTLNTPFSKGWFDAEEHEEGCRV